MTSFRWLSHIFPENAITCAELIYQRRSEKVFSPFRQKINRFVRWLMTLIAIIQLDGLLIASLTQQNPIPLIESLQPLPTLVILPVILYQLYLMFQTLSISARSISREKESQTWDLLVLTGIDARQIVCSKWWATIQHQFPAYSFVALLHIGMITAAALNPFTWASSRGAPNYQIEVKLPHPFTLLYVALFGFGFTVINLCFSAACGVMASAASKNDRVAFIRGIFNQIALSILVAFVVMWVFNQLFINQFIEYRNLYAGISVAALSLVDNGFIAGISSIGPFKDEYNQFGPSMIKPISLEFFIISAAGIITYLPLIWFALRRAEANATRAAALPPKRSAFFHRIRHSSVTPVVRGDFNGCPHIRYYSKAYLSKPMTLSRLSSAFFPENAITRAELTYQQRSNKPPRRWRLWLNRTVTWLAITVALIMFGGLLIASLTQHDPTSLLDTLKLPVILLILFALIYHLYLMFQTISLAANSVAREKESQTWEVLVLTGIDARQIVRGKWWATVQRQLPHYLLLGLLRVGVTSAFAISNLQTFYRMNGNFYTQVQLPQAHLILFSSLLGIALSVANLGLSVACGVIGGTAVQHSAIAIPRGIISQIIISVFPAIYLVLVSSLFFSGAFSNNAIAWWQAVLIAIGLVGVSLIDNGIIASTIPLYAQTNDTSLMNASVLLGLLLSIIVYALLVWFALAWAEKNAVETLATSFDKSLSIIK